MKVLIIAKRFPPEMMPAAVMAKELAEEMGRRGWEVMVVGGYPHHPYGRLFPGYRMKWATIEDHEGFRLVRGWHLIHPNPAIPVQALMMTTKCLSYMIGTYYSFSPDVVLSFEAEPLIGPLVASLIARRYGAISVNLVFDIYPDTIVGLGKLKNQLLIFFAKILEKSVYRLSDRIVVLSEGFRQTLVKEKGVDPDKVTVIPIWLDVQDIKPMDKDNQWRQDMGIPPEKFVVLHAGTIGYVAGAGVIIEAAQHLTFHPDILFLLVGDGFAKTEIQLQARNLQLPNVRFFPFQPRQRLSELQATADISLVTLAPGRGRTSVPSKILGYMAAARPIIASVDEACDTASLVKEANCGLVVPPGNGDALAQAILYYYKHPSERISSGNNGLAYFLKNFNKNVIINQYVNLIETLIRR